ncbi:MAG: phage Gp37/Gp68 family protein [Pseudomonadota bacterium]|nr:phage Gp37/Gp68 family protein [Pseudomonadota bacterium]
MGENTKISWTDHTFNPWWGCQKVGPGCDHCYAESLDKRTGGAHWGPGALRRRTSAVNWNKPRRWQKEAVKNGRRYRVFCASMADVFDNAVPTEWRGDLWQLIRETPALDWLLLTKRIGNVASMLPPDWNNGWKNVWLLATVVTQAEADRDVPKLTRLPAAVHGLSIEPQIENIIVPQRVDWIITGAESGHGARPYSEDWARSLRDQSAAMGAAFFYKQRIEGGRKIETPELDGQRHVAWPTTSKEADHG